jgi:ribonuclease HI
MGDSRVAIYTDGACRGNPGPGGWGAILIYDGHEKELYGAERETTNNRMELMAVIRALEAVKRPCGIDLYTDSSYVKNGWTEWLAAWKRRAWRTSDKKPVKNQDLWRQLDSAGQAHDLSLHWIKGHSGHPLNERADALANRAIDEINA